MLKRIAAGTKSRPHAVCLVSHIVSQRLVKKKASGKGVPDSVLVFGRPLQTHVHGHARRLIEMYMRYRTLSRVVD